MEAIKAAVAVGRVRLTEKFPHLLESLHEATQENADLVGLTLKELKEVVLLKTIAEFARSQGDELIDLLIKYGAESEEDAAALLARKREIVAQSSSAGACMAEAEWLSL